MNFNIIIIINFFTEVKNFNFKSKIIIIIINLDFKFIKITEFYCF